MDNNTNNNTNNNTINNTAPNWYLGPVNTRDNPFIVIDFLQREVYSWCDGWPSCVHRGEAYMYHVKDIPSIILASWLVALIAKDPTPDDHREIDWGIQDLREMWGYMCDDESEEVTK